MRQGIRGLLRQRTRGQAMVEFVLILPIILFLMIGGTTLLLRLLYIDTLENAAEEVAWVAASTGGSESAIESVLRINTRLMGRSDLAVCVTSAGFHQPVLVQLRYTGTTFDRLPWFNEPLPPAFATATNQQEDGYALGGACNGSRPTLPSAGPATQPNTVPTAPDITRFQGQRGTLDASGQAVP